MLYPEDKEKNIFPIIEFHNYFLPFLERKSIAYEEYITNLD